LIIQNPFKVCGEGFTPPSGTVWENAIQEHNSLDLQWGKEIVNDSITIRSLRYTGSVWKGEPQRVYALYAHPDGEGPFPAILQIHGGGQTCYPSNVEYFVKHGYACLSFDWTGSRKERPIEEITNWHKDFADSIMGPDDQAPGQNLIFHAVLAALRGIGVLADQPEVDEDRIGVQGISWGGYITWLVNGLDTRVKAAVPTYGVGGLAEQWSDIARSMKARSPEFTQLWKTNYEPEVFAPLQHGPVCFLNATNDFFGQLPEAEQRLAQVSVNHRRGYSPNQMHSLAPTTVSTGMAWFDAHLKSDGRFPKEPVLSLEAHDQGLLKAVIQVDELWPVACVHVNYSRGSLPALLKCWLSTDAVREASGTWSAVLPFVESAQPMSTIAQAVYEGGFMLSSPVTEAIPAMLFPGVSGSEMVSDTISDWTQGPSGWFIQRGTDFIHADNPEAELVLKEVESHPCLAYVSPEPITEIHVATRLVADPARAKGNRRHLEIWTHDLSVVTLRTDWFLRQPGAKVYQVNFEGGAGWKQTVIALDQLRPYDEDKNEEIVDGDPLAHWNDVHQLNLIARTADHGEPAVGLIRWVD